MHLTIGIKIFGIAVGLLILMAVEERRRRDRAGNHRQARHGAGGRAGGAAEGIRPAEHVTLRGSRKRPNTPKTAWLPRCS